VRSEVGHGSCFTVRLPRTVRLGSLDRPHRASIGIGPPLQLSVDAPGVESAAAAPPRPPVVRPGRAAVRLLIAEDNADMRAYLSEILAEDYEVELQPNGRAALAAARARPPMVIISDVMMPDLDGFQLVAQLKQDAALRDIPIILLTARASRSELVSGLDLGADDYLGKPFDPEELKARVRAAERLHRAYLELAAKNRELTVTLRQLADSQAELLQAGKMAAVGTLIAGLSHELNNPLGVILMNAQLILRKQRNSPGGLDEATLQKPLHLIESQAMRCADLVRALLEYVRRKPVTREPCEVRVALERVLTITGLQASKRKVHLEVQYDTGALPAVLVSPTQFDSALLNIVNNALDAVSEGGSVVIAARPLVHQGTPGLELQVRDTGCGISSEISGRIGEPFFTTKPPGQGTGLGLSMTKRFFEDHSGDLRIESQPGVGTTVYMWLPAMSAVASAHGPATS
jgi:signal transduction histidine kinase